MKKELFNELLQSVKEAAVIKRKAGKSSRQFEVKPARNIACAPRKPAPQKRANRIKTHLSLSEIKICYDPVESLGYDAWPASKR